MPVRILAASVVLLGNALPTRARERHIDLKETVEGAPVICVCTVEEARDDGSVTVTPDEVLKGELPEQVTISGETGDAGPATVAQYMRPRRRYLVFLDEGHRVGRNSNTIVVIDDDRARLDGVNGFEDVVVDEETGRHWLPLEKAVRQIRELVRQSEADVTVEAGRGSRAEVQESRGGRGVECATLVWRVAR